MTVSIVLEVIWMGARGSGVGSGCEAPSGCWRPWWCSASRGAETNRGAAGAFAANVLPIIRQIEAASVTGFRSIVEASNARGIRTARGGSWHATAVRTLATRRAV